jgi:hypothetical protein
VKRLDSLLTLLTNNEFTTVTNTLTFVWFWLTYLTDVRCELTKEFEVVTRERNRGLFDGGCDTGWDRERNWM